MVFKATPLALPSSAHAHTSNSHRNVFVLETSQLLSNSHLFPNAFLMLLPKMKLLFQGSSCYHKEQSFAVSFFQDSALTYYYSCHFCSLIMLHSHVHLLDLYYPYISQSFTSRPLSGLIYLPWIANPKFISLSFHRMNLKVLFWLHLEIL